LLMLICWGSIVRPMLDILANFEGDPMRWRGHVVA
jgi:hypothetical protein